MKKTQLLFVINPFSGIGRKKIIPRILDSKLDKTRFDWDITYTEKAKHAIEISKNAVVRGYDAVVAVGGDGSINEVAQSLIHTNTALGIIPGGSGNGIARSLNIPLQIKKAVELINAFNLKTIDTGLLNQHIFVGVAGIGYDALISKEFAARKMRGKLSYALVILKKIKSFKAMNVTVDSLAYKSTKAVVLAFANTPQYGNNAFISPKADPTDGKLKLTIIEKFSALELTGITEKIFTKRILKSKKVSDYEFSEIEIHHESPYAHIDGEPIEIPSVITVRVIPSSLKVIC